jgi:PAS domain S-box-containing protein
MFFNFFAVGSLIPICFHLYLAFFFLMIPRKSRATFHLGIGFIFLAIVSLGFFAAASIYHPLAAFHRWNGACMIFFAFTHFNMFMFYFLDEERVRLGRALLAIQYTGQLAIGITFCIMTFNAGKIYQFAGHFWDLDSDRISSVLGVLILIYITLFIMILAWKIASKKKRERWTVALIGIAYLLASLAPAVAYSQTRAGIIGRDVYQNTYNLFTLFGFFILAILYINVTRDRTTLMAKIIGISLVTFLAVLQGWSFYFFQDKEESYNSLQLARTRLAVEAGYRGPDLEYLASYSLDHHAFTVHYQKSGSNAVDFDLVKDEFINAAMWERVRVSGAGIRSTGGVSRFFEGYAGMIRSIAGEGPLEYGNDNRVMGILTDHRNLINHQAHRIRDIPDASFRAELIALIKGEYGPFRPFRAAILSFLESSDLEGAALKTSVLRFLTPLVPAGSRRYRESGPQHYVSFMQPNGDGSTVYEVGFSYRAYRSYMHPSAMKLIIILGVILCAVMGGFRLFFRRTLLKPMFLLVHGLEGVEKGDLGITVPVSVEDEIGFMSRAFNQMVESLRRATRERREAEEALRASEEKYRTIFENGVTANLLFDESTIIRLGNTESERLTGYTRSEVEGKMSWTSFVVKEDLDRLLEYHRSRRIRDSLAPNRYEFRLLDRYGNIKHVINNIAMIPGTKLSIASLIDITDMRKAEHEVLRMRAFLKNIIDSMPSMLVGVDSSGTIIHWNSETEKATKIPEDAARGRKLKEIFPFYGVLENKIEAAMLERRPSKLEKHKTEGSDGARYFDIIVYPLLDNGIEGFVIRIDDITARVRIEEVMVQTEKMMSVGGLAAGMAHEINNPLGAIMMAAQNILRRVATDSLQNQEAAKVSGTDLEAVKRYLDNRDITKMMADILKMGERASSIISNMLRFSRKSDSGMVLADMLDLVERSIDLVKSDYDLKKKYDFNHINLVRDFDPDIPLLPCIPTEIQQVLINLMKNAAHAMAQKAYSDDHPRIALRMKRVEDMLLMEVEDNGPGIDEATRKRIFEPFFTTKAVGQGTGLGLSVSYFIITNNHKGTMGVESAAGSGAKFIIHLPLRQEGFPAEPR